MEILFHFNRTSSFVDEKPMTHPPLVEPAQGQLREALPICNDEWHQDSIQTLSASLGVVRCDMKGFLQLSEQSSNGEIVLCFYDFPVLQRAADCELVVPLFLVSKQKGLCSLQYAPLFYSLYK